VQRGKLRLRKPHLPRRKEVARTSTRRPSSASGTSMRRLQAVRLQPPLLRATVVGAPEAQSEVKVTAPGVVVVVAPAEVKANAPGAQSEIEVVVARAEVKVNAPGAQSEVGVGAPRAQSGVGVGGPDLDPEVEVEVLGPGADPEAADDAEAAEGSVYYLDLLKVNLYFSFFELLLF
ncbi:unnamed protein product, partial [Polarella glacialis]